MLPIRFACAALHLGLLVAAAGPALAQDAVYRSVTAPAGRTTRLAVVPNLKKDCKPGEGSAIRVVTPPKNGSLIVRTGKVKTPAAYRCPNIETTVQALFYKPNERYAGSDEVVIENKLPDGQPQAVTIRITVDGKPAPAGKPAKDDNGIEL